LFETFINVFLSMKGRKLALSSRPVADSFIFVNISQNVGVKIQSNTEEGN
jgi:hypothetical protein